MKRSIVISALVTLMLAPFTPSVSKVAAKSPTVLVVGEYGYFGIDSEGGVHYVLTNDGFRYYDVPTYGYCGRHHCHHRCRFVPPGHCKPCKDCRKHYKKMKKKHRKHHHCDHHHGPERRR